MAQKWNNMIQQIYWLYMKVFNAEQHKSTFVHSGLMMMQT